jgi:hypothetical protein
MIPRLPLARTNHERSEVEAEDRVTTLGIVATSLARAGLFDRAMETASLALAEARCAASRRDRSWPITMAGAALIDTGRHAEGLQRVPEISLVGHRAWLLAHALVHGVPDGSASVARRNRGARRA